jgi:hypothetical protein
MITMAYINLNGTAPRVLLEEHADAIAARSPTLPTPATTRPPLPARSALHRPSIAAASPGSKA